MRRSDHFNAAVLQGMGQPDQRQALNRGGIATVYALEQDHAPAFSLEAAGAVQWLVCGNIASGQSLGQCAEPYPSRVQVIELGAVAGSAIAATLSEHAGW